jgi:anti-sigma factor RsiW
MRGHAIMGSATRAERRQPPRDDLTCREITSLILDYVAGDLHRKTSGDFESHLQSCPDCVAFLETYKKTMALTQSFLRARTGKARQHRGGRPG